MPSNLETYRAKRDFRRTPEPKGKARRVAPGQSFVVQKHDASRLHYDFRLEMDGVLKSWAVPKGPSLDPRVRRLAVRTEDHPIEYGGFEGTIPEGEYGGGTVMLWDRGTWTPEGDVRRDFAKGSFHFTLYGQRLKGEFILTRLKPRKGEKGENWLLIKRNDAEAWPGSEDAVVVENERSVATERGMDAIAAGEKVWHSNRSNASRKAATQTVESPAERRPAPRPGAKGKMTDPAAIEGARRGNLPRQFQPQLATLAEDVPEGTGWVNEVKFDGYRILARIQEGRVTLLSRNGNDWTRKLPSLARAVEGLGLTSAMLDGELVSLDESGHSNFSLLKNDLSDGRTDRFHYYVFDLPYLGGYDLTQARLTDRKDALRAVVPVNSGGMIRYSDHVEGGAGAVHERACAMRLEGIICKQANAPYVQRRTKTWLKVKCIGREEFVVLGFTDPSGSREGLGSLHLGYYDGEGELHYAGGVGTGFNRKTLRNLRAQLSHDVLRVSRPIVFHAGTQPKRIHWVEPRLVVEIQYLGWTDDKILRHSVFLGVREDKEAKDVVREPPGGSDRVEEKPRRLGLPNIIEMKQPATTKKSGSKARRLRAGARALPKIIDTTRAAHPDVALTHPDKLLWTEEKITKAELAEYWRAVAKWALPHISGRPIALVRCPDGKEGECFFQKKPSPGFPKAILAPRTGKETVLAVEDEAGLVALAQMGTLEVHGWGARLDRIEYPDLMTFDLDPGEGVDFAEVVKAALHVRDTLKALGLTSFCKTTGGKGLHVVVPLKPQADWDAVKGFAKTVADKLEAEAPDSYTATLSKRARTRRIFVDYLRNGRGATAIVPFSTRARAGATVAVPLEWREVTGRLDPARFTLRTVPARLARQKRDPWDGFASAAAVIDDVLLAKLAGKAALGRRKRHG